MNEIKLIPVETITIVNNSRRTASNEALKGLAESIEAVGLLQPITVVPTDQKSVFRLVFGHRRYSAVMMLGWEVIPCIVSEMDEARILAVQLIENLQREDVTPMDEQLAFQELINAKWTLKQISDEIGKSERYVRDRLNLSLLLDDVQELVISGIATISHALQFAKLTHVDQLALLDMVTTKNDDGEVKDIMAVKELMFRINNHFKLLLTNAPFDTSDVDINKPAGACLTCPKRSGANASLFPDDLEADICFDSVCYNLKQTAFIETKIAEFIDKDIAVVRITDKWIDSDESAATSVYTSYTQHFMNDDVDHNIYPIKKMAIKVGTFDGKDVGSLHPLYTDKQWEQKTKHERSTQILQDEDPEIAELRLTKEKARVSFMTNIVNTIALRTSEVETPVIPDGLLRYFIMLIYDDMLDVDKKLFLKYYDWKVEVDKDQDGFTVVFDYTNYGKRFEASDELFTANIYRYSGRDLAEMVVYITLSLLKHTSSTADTFEFSCLMEAAKQTRIDLDEVVADVENSFGVDLDDVIEFVTK